MGCDLFFEISVREEADVARRVMEDLYGRWKYNQSHHHSNSSHHHQQQPHCMPPPMIVAPSWMQSHFGRRCLETFTGRCSASKSSSMDVINEKEDQVPVVPISLSLGECQCAHTLYGWC